jgi:hypothetical protein
MDNYYVSDKNAIIREGAPNFKAVAGNKIIPLGTRVTQVAPLNGKYIQVQYTIGNTNSTVWTSSANLSIEQVVHDATEYWMQSATSFAATPFGAANAAFEAGTVVKQQKKCGAYTYLFDEIKKIGGWLLTPVAFFKAPKDRAKNFAWFGNVNAWNSLPNISAADLAVIEMNRAAINDRTDKSTYVTRMYYTETSLKGYAYGGKDVKQAAVTNFSKKKTEVTELLKKEIMHEGGYSAINAYDGEIFTWGKGFAYTGQLPIVFEKLMAKNVAYRNIFQKAGLDFTSKTFYAVDQKGAVLSGKTAANYVRTDKRLLNFLIEFAEKEEYAQDVANAQMEALMVGALKIPDYIVDEVANKYKDNWSDESVSMLCHLSHWLPAGGWNNNSFAATKGEIRAVMYQFMANIFKLGIQQAKYENGVKSWKEAFDWIDNAMKNFGQPKGNARKVFDTTWNVALTKELEFRKEAGKTLNSVFIKGSNEKLKNVFIMKDGNQYRILVPPGDMLSNYVIK